ncbi:hypothetical protein GMDG_04558 [Pseudogymnoascus destructans 20631-21]|uniref:Transcription initiation factor IIA subunit 2 n=2 Tax=Pseudogymnoascus destructans TaxID=655981 RepID=L8GBD0_PSED2|nr:hypothetical protein GMDG_04558 [Pseudogymnoascus destructans 20631-21]
MASSDVESSVYFHTSLCKTLCDTIDDLICAGRIEPQLGAKLLKNFVPSVKKAFAEHVREVVNMKGRLQYYRNYEDKWWWVVRDCTVKLRAGVDAEMLRVDKLRIVGYPAGDELNGKKGGGLEAVEGKIKQKIKRKIKGETKQETKQETK